MSLLDRLTETLSGFLDEASLGDRARLALDHATAAVARSAWAEARARLDEAEQAGARVWRLSHLRGLVAAGEGHPHEALRWLSQAQEQRDHPLNRLAMARVTAGLGDLPAALLLLEEGVRQPPRSPSDTPLHLQLLEELAELAQRADRPAERRRALQRAHELAPRSSSHAEAFARQLVQEGRTQEARLILEDLQIREASAALLLAELLLQQSDAEAHVAAAQLLEGLEAARLAEDERWKLARAQALLTARARQPAPAIAALRTALAHAPIGEQAEIHAALAEVHRDAEQLETALDHAHAAAALAPDRADLQLGLARCARDAGAIGALLTAAEAAHRLAPDRPEARALLGTALLRLNREEEAQPLLRPLRVARPAPDLLIALAEQALHAEDPAEALALLREARARGARQHAVAAPMQQALARIGPRLPALPPHDRIDAGALAPLLDSLGQALGAHPLLQDLVPRATSLREQLDTPLAIAVLGEFNAGKSTFINALLGEAVLATGVLPTTSHINVIRYGPRPIARWTLHDGEVREIPFGEAAQLVREQPELIAGLEFCFPHPQLRSIHFWDTPGFNAPDDAHEERAEVALRSADAIFWLLSAGQPLTESELNRVASIRGAAEKLIIVLNKIDRLESEPGAVDELLAHIRRGLKTPVAGLFPASALDALRAAQQEAPPPEPWVRVQQNLQSTFIDRAGRLKATEIGRELHHLLTLVTERGRSAIEELKGARDELAALRTSLREHGRRWETQTLPEAARALDEALREQREQLRQTLTPGPSDAQILLAALRRQPRRAPLIGPRLLQEHARHWEQAAGRLVAAALPFEQEVIRRLEALAAPMPASEARAARHRLDAWLMRTDELKTRLQDRSTRLASTRLEVRIDERLDEAARAFAQPLSTEIERQRLLNRLLPAEGHELVEAGQDWMRNHHQATERLCEQLERDLDILALDLEHRMVRPFEPLIEALDPAPTSHEAS